MTDLDDAARAILRANDRGGYTVPSPRLYPHQWNWDSAFAALGFATFDRDRAWRELEMIFEAQWPDGMAPHIVFRADDPGYFPGPDVWGCGAAPPSSGVSQPPVATSVARWLLEAEAEADGTGQKPGQEPGQKPGQERAAALFPKLLAWHRWFQAARDPDGAGVMAVVHPWESGRDNSPDWDAALAAIDPSGVPPYTRRDTSHVDPSMRPTKDDYDRYLKIIQFCRDAGWRADAIHRDGPFWVADPGMTFIVHRAERDLLAIAERLGRRAEADEIAVWVARHAAGAERLWNEAAQAYCAVDLRSGRVADAATSASFLAWYAGPVAPARAAALTETLSAALEAVSFGVASFDPADRRHDGRRYWRGPAWAPVNYLVGRGLREQGETALAERVRLDTRRMIEASGFQEYYDPQTGAGAGGDGFTWTAAVWLAWAGRAPDAPLFSA